MACCSWSEFTEADPWCKGWLGEDEEVGRPSYLIDLITLIDATRACLELGGGC
jgi:hypothetical protein